MATLASGTYIPSELISLIISHIHSRKHLIGISLVSHVWQRLAFPVLWYEVELTEHSHMDRFIIQIQSEPDDPELRISQHLRLLFVHRSVESGLIINFQQIIPKLSVLKHLTWRGQFPYNVPIFETFQQSCPTLRSFDINYGGMSPLTGEQETAAFGFNNLTHVTLPAGALTAGLAESISPMVQMVNNLPNLVTLGIRFRTGPGNRQPDQFFQALHRNFPALRKLEIGGSFTIDWDGFYDQTSPLYRFFEQHPGLHTINFNWDYSDHSRISPPVEKMFDRLFPSLQEFRGSSTLCAQVVSSPKLSQQLTKLKIVPGTTQTDSTHPSDIGFFSQAVTWLPQLQSFEYSTHHYNTADGPLDVGSLNKILAASPSLTCLKIPYFSDKLLDLLEPLEHVQRLSTLVLFFDYPPDENHAASLREFAYRVSVVCPKLSQVNSSSYFNSYESLEIKRMPDGIIQLS